MIRSAKIIATLGPSTNDPAILIAMIKAGMNVARINFSHGELSDHLQRIKLVRQCADSENCSISILQDLQGPKLRVGDLPADGVRLEIGQTCKLVSVLDDPAVTYNSNSPVIIPVFVPLFSKSIAAGNRILLDDGKIELEVSDLDRLHANATVITGGTLYSRKGINLPLVNLSISAFTEKDLQDLEFGLIHGVDFIALSFVRTATDIYELKDKIRSLSPDGRHVPIIAKIERPEAVNNIHDIIMAADGVMVARGDLAVETSPSQVPIFQKMIIKQAAYHAKTVITATQMLESMISNPRPTRAEASDVANAIFDGSDAVMLSGETAVGQYPVETVKMMATIIEEAEKNYSDWGKCKPFEEDSPGDDAVSITRAARELAHDRNVDAIAVFTLSGRTALFMSKARPRVPIIAFTPNESTFRLMSLYWGVQPIISPFSDTVESMLWNVDSFMQNEMGTKRGQQIVVISGFPIGAMRPPNLAIMHTIGE